MMTIALSTRIAQLTAAALAHPYVADKSPKGIASRVARVLNREGYKPDGAPYYTGAMVQGLGTTSADVEAVTAGK